MVAKPSSLVSNLNTAATKKSSGKYTSPYASLFTEMKERNTAFGANDTNTRSEPARLKCGIPEYRLRFKTVNYPRLELSPYVHPNEYKVTLKVYLNDIPLETDLEKEIFHQIVGQRYREDFGELRLSSKQFASRIENKRHLTSMLDRIVIGAKRLAKDISEKETGTP
jgi:hypothetical protein